jgi:DNA ligase D-like protein (predicted 3'-phosphoesterase)
MSRLQNYRDKRDLRSSPEPGGADRSSSGGAPRFVIQQHDASSLHWDLRLEADGVLVSWAVPKGPSTDPREKRLAHRVEDHPLDYVDFEGVIPADEYGGGSVVVWDTGSYTNTTTDDDGGEVAVDDALEDGHLSFELHGEKLTGGFSLTRFRGEDDWLLVKQRGEGADARRRPTSTQPESVLSGRTNDEVAAAEGDPS